MILAQAALIFATQLTDSTTNYPYDHAVMAEAVAAIVETTQDVREVSILIAIGRWESGAWRKDIADCRTRGDSGIALSAWQVHPFNDEEKRKLCGTMREQAEVALFHVRDSVAICKMHGYRGSSLITIYTHGRAFIGDGVSRSHWSDGAALTKLLYTETNEVLSKKNHIKLTSDVDDARLAKE